MYGHNEKKIIKYFFYRIQSSILQRIKRGIQCTNPQSETVQINVFLGNERYKYLQENHLFTYIKKLYYEVLLTLSMENEKSNR